MVALVPGVQTWGLPICLLLQRQCRGTAEDALGQFAVEPLAERLETVLLGDRIDRYEADVMPVTPVLGARIAQSDEEQHERSALAQEERGGLAHHRCASP